MSKFEKAVIFCQMMFSFSKRQVHIFNMPATIVQNFRMISQKLWQENFFEGMDGRTDRRTRLKHNATPPSDCHHGGGGRGGG